jgi:hypothetical protein
VILSFVLFIFAEREISSESREKRASKTSCCHSISVPSKLPDFPDKTSFLETVVSIFLRIGRADREANGHEGREARTRDGDVEKGRGRETHVLRRRAESRRLR